MASFRDSGECQVGFSQASLPIPTTLSSAPPYPAVEASAYEIFISMPSTYIKLKTGTYCKDLLSKRTIIQELPMRLLSTFSGIDSRPTPHLGRASEETPDDLENKELETGPFAHGFCDNPAWVGVVDDDFPFLGRRCGDSFGDFLDAVHF